MMTISTRPTFDLCFSLDTEASSATSAPAAAGDAAIQADMTREGCTGLVAGVGALIGGAAAAYSLWPTGPALLSGVLQGAAAGATLGTIVAGPVCGGYHP